MADNEKVLPEIGTIIWDVHGRGWKVVENDEQDIQTGDPLIRVKPPRGFYYLSLEEIVEGSGQ